MCYRWRMPIRRFVARVPLVIACCLALPSLYLLAALVLGLVARNGDYQAVPDGIDVYIRTNGVHTDLVVPIRASNVDWATRLPLALLRPIPGFTDDLAFGWGDRKFYIDTPTWADLHTATAASALMGFDTSVLHVEAVLIPHIGVNTRHIQLSSKQYELLADFIERAFQRDANGGVIPIKGAAYGFRDAFFEAKGHYSLLTTCNDWTRRALDAAGVRVPLWSPFDRALFYQLDPR